MLDVEMMNDNLQLVNLPEKIGLYKVMQFSSPDKAYVRFGLRPDGDFHEDILERFADTIKVNCILIPGPSGPIAGLPENIEYKLVGAGKCDVNCDRKTQVFYGESRDYQIGIDGEHLSRYETELEKEFPGWKIG